MALVYPPHIHLGPQSSSRPSKLTSLGITHVLSIGHKPASLPLPAPVQHLHLSLLDDLTADLASVIPPAAAFLELASTAGGRALVHCSAGLSRSPSVVAGVLVSQHGLTLKEAMRRVVDARGDAVRPNNGFWKALGELEEGKLGARSYPEPEEGEGLPATAKERIRFLFG
ncbi:phosphatases II [Gonapodya prolifera JEL478]|uniref:Phosphatases II n=1 Tax=Gonapodya prolifera (strain JEL478) TaxID=1344416 RepID=A0A139A4H0_GONPJ|nr:phosphatases II [Gonapodya prolifera JEL478]|eukprot:KXS11692.1 phosphatases II [Gonapodya prolifera JEL478]